LLLVNVGQSSLQLDGLSRYNTFTTVFIFLELEILTLYFVLIFVDELGEGATSGVAVSNQHDNFMIVRDSVPGVDCLAQKLKSFCHFVVK